MTKNNAIFAQAKFKYPPVLYSEFYHATGVARELRNNVPAEREQKENLEAL